FKGAPSLISPEIMEGVVDSCEAVLRSCLRRKEMTETKRGKRFGGRSRRKRRVVFWFDGILSGEASVMEEARRGEGEKRKMSDLVSEKEKRREVAAGWYEWRSNWRC
ncbi:hypothetical protein HAX54_030290, partial [Datura stramonium]|nr:hypothetical protein [Datura stramonium]